MRVLRLPDSTNANDAAGHDDDDVVVVGMMEAELVLEPAAVAAVWSRNGCHGLVAGQEKDWNLLQARCNYSCCRRTAGVARPGVVARSAGS